MKDWSIKKTAKKLIKRAKKHPDWYSEQDIYYAKQVKKQLKLEERELQVKQNKDGSFTFEWDKNDPSYNFLNNLTQEQIQSIIMSDMKSH